MLYLVFNTYDSAYIANAIISHNMRLSGNVTIQWAEVQERLDGKFVIPKPDVVPLTEEQIAQGVEDESVMRYVTGYTEEEYSPVWFGVGVGE